MANPDNPDFTLDPRLAADSRRIGRMRLCEVRLMDDRRWPWLLLVPMRGDVSEWHELGDAETQRAAGEIRIASAALKIVTGCLKVNVATLGNIVRQFHVHVVARIEGDPNWPGPVWGFGKRKPYPDQERAQWIRRVGNELAKSGEFFGDTV